LALGKDFDSSQSVLVLPFCCFGKFFSGLSFSEKVGRGALGACGRISFLADWLLSGLRYSGWGEQIADKAIEAKGELDRDPAIVTARRHEPGSRRFGDCYVEDLRHWQTRFGGRA